jgi:hypothetical protein
VLAILPWSSKVLFVAVAIIATLLMAFLVWQIENTWIEPRRAKLSMPAPREGLKDAKAPPVVGNVPLPVENRQAAAV